MQKSKCTKLTIVQKKLACKFQNIWDRIDTFGITGFQTHKNVKQKNKLTNGARTADDPHRKEHRHCRDQENPTNPEWHFGTACQYWRSKAQTQCKKTYTQANETKQVLPHSRRCPWCPAGASYVAVYFAKSCSRFVCEIEQFGLVSQSSFAAWSSR